MKVINKAIPLLFLVVVMLTACNRFVSPPTISPTDVMKTAMSSIEAAIVETQTAIPTTSTPKLPTLISPTPSPLPPTKTPTPIKTSLPVSDIPTVIALENGLTWSECVVPNREYFYTIEDEPIVTNCLDFPDWDAYDPRKSGERIKGSNGSDLQLVIDSDTFLAKYYSANGCCDYKFLKNGKVIMEASALRSGAFDPNRNLWNFGGKAVWELVANPPTIIVDGIDINYTYQWEASFFPYEIKGKLIYIAKKNGKYHIVYDGEIIGTEFDQISIAYSSARLTVVYGNQQYWFLGQREGTQFVVLIR
jgi:hypothetical protein